MLAATTRTTSSQQQQQRSRLPRLPSLRFLFFVLLLLQPRSSNNNSNYRDGISLVYGLPTGFRDEGIVTKAGASAFSFIPKNKQGDYMIFLTLKRGEMVAIPNPDDEDPTQIDILDIKSRVCNNGERGLQTVVAHPNFLQNHYIYIYYTYDKYGDCLLNYTHGPVNRLSRFTVQDPTHTNITIDKESEYVLLETSSLPDKVHNGGDMAFGNDGYLWLTIGDGGARDHDEPQNLSYLQGSLIRITETGDIPPDNPFANDSQGLSQRCHLTGKASNKNIKCQEIYAYGLRNPYRFAKNPNTLPSVTEFYINDVGGSKWEEINVAGTHYKGVNYGYRLREGPCKVGEYNDCDKDDLSEETILNLVDPIYWYKHDSNGFGAITGGAFVPSNSGWPSEYTNTYIYADFIFQNLYVIKRDVTKGCYYPTCNPPEPPFEVDRFYNMSSVGQPTQITFGPSNHGRQIALYYTTWASRGGKNLRRIIYESDDTTGQAINNQSPVAFLAVNTTKARIGETVLFNASGSYDPDVNDRVTYQWDFGDGTPLYTREKEYVTHKYESNGNYDITVTVVDSKGYESSAFVNVDVGEWAPIPMIVQPTEGTKFAVGDKIKLIGWAVDGIGHTLEESSLTWEVRQHHGTHWHPFLDETTGNNIQIDPAPAPEDFEAATNSYLEVRLTATDAYGYSTTISVELQPMKTNLVFSSFPSGMVLELDGFQVQTPVVAVSWMNHHLKINAPDQDILYFQSWSDGGDRSHTIQVGKSESVLVATFSETPIFMGSKGTNAKDDCVDFFGLCYDNNDCCEDLVCRLYSILSAERACIGEDDPFVSEPSATSGKPAGSPIFDMAKPSVSQPWIPIAERPTRPPGSSGRAQSTIAANLLLGLFFSNVIWMILL